MKKISPKIAIDGKSVEYLEGSYTYAGGGTAAELSFSMPLQYGGNKKLWNKEVLLYLDEADSTPIFRGWIRRAQPTLDDIEILAMDALGYTVKGGETTKSSIVLTRQDNLDGYTSGAAIVEAIKRAKLDTKLYTDFIRNTTPSISASRFNFRGRVTLQDIIQAMVYNSVDESGTLPRPNLYKLVDDGSNSQLVIEPEADVDTAQIAHIFTEESNIISLTINEKKIPTIILVRGKDGVEGTFTHDSAITALDRTYLEVDNNQLTSPAECKNFGRKLFEANLKNQYEYALEVTEGSYLAENEVIRVETNDRDFSGNYRVIGKSISFSPASFNVGITINKKPPTLAEYIADSDN
jgi:hypothetical protein